ncbi:MAG: phosphate/phosphite/phosphonate ABC transporter substrate-binding protein [Myxococcaceae bacterium]|nr:phosphate/phosphite/phosphonate ABC transporter substrate-binding protein [Myxococcaceae bacterium]
MKRRAWIALAEASLVLAWAGCTQQDLEPPPRQAEPPPDPDFRPPAGFEKLTLSTTPYLDPEKLNESLQPLASYLSRYLHVPVEVVRANSYAHVGTLMKEGQVDLGSFSPLSYVRAKENDPGLIPLVNFISDGSATSAGYIVVKESSPFQTLEDLKGHSFAFVDPDSTTGYLYAVALMRSRNIDEKTWFSRTEFTGNHEASLQAVYDGRVDAAAIYQGALPALYRNKGIDPLSFRIIAKTRRTPKDLFCVRSGLPKEVVTQIRRAFLALTVRTEEGRRVLSPLNVNGFTQVDEEAYTEVREVNAQFAGKK